MTAESAQRQHSWPVPPPGGYTVDDLSTLPDLPPHTELLDGSLIFLSPQRRFHARMIDLLVTGLRRAAPVGCVVEREMTVALDRKNGPEPDVSVVKAEAVTSLEQTSFVAEDVLLAIEVVSPDSQARDREIKPRKYAAAGIAHFWLVEMTEGNNHPVVHVYELDHLSGAYALTGIHHEQLKVEAPFTVDLDIGMDALNAL